MARKKQVTLADRIECCCQATIRCEICQCRETMEHDLRSGAKKQLLDLLGEKGWKIVEDEALCPSCARQAG